MQFPLKISRTDREDTLKRVLRSKTSRCHLLWLQGELMRTGLGGIALGLGQRLIGGI